MARVLTVSRPLLLVPAIALIGCGAFSDPAVRLARCLDSAVNGAAPSTEKIEATCDLQISGNYVVVLHPSGTVSDADLVAAGVPESAVPELRAMRISDNESIYVIATDAGVNRDSTTPSSRTTSQGNVVKIPHLFVQSKTALPVVVEVGGPATARVVQAIH